MNDWRTILAIDHDHKACEVYRANIAAERVECGSVADLVPTMPYADVVLGGPPCQPYSSAGKRAGEDDARDCVPDFCAAIERVRPRMFLMEEVDAFATDAKFQPVLQRTFARLTRAGYDVQMRVLDAVDFGVPQFRNRCWLWGVRTDLGVVIARRKWPTPTHCDPASLRDGWMFGCDLQPWVTVGQALGLDGWYDAQNDRAHGPGEPCGTIQGEAQSKGGGAGHYAIRRARGASVDRRDHGADEPCPTITDGSGGSGGVLRLIQSHADPARPVSEPASTLRSGGSGHDGCCVRIIGGGLDEPCSTLVGGSSSSHTNGTSIIREPLRSAIRRLTVFECARLQSMPDDFIWPDSVKKTHRYRVIGNGWASLMANRMSEAFSAADPESRTVIDLFCGGGCGAVGWHGRAWEYTPEESRAAS